MNAKATAAVVRFLQEKVEKGFYPGCQVIVAQDGEMIIDECLGTKVKGSSSPEDRVVPRTLFNLESITKVMVTLPVTFKLVEQGLLHLDDRVADYLPEFGATEVKKAITVRQLLTFTGGIPLEDPEGAEDAARAGDLEHSWRLHYEQKLGHQPGTRVLYSDVSCRILGRVLESAAGMNLGEAAEKWFFKPLGMLDTTFVPTDKSRCAATGLSDAGRVLRGELTQDLEHDLGEVLGSDGIFSTARDMFVFSQMLLDGGCCNGVRVLSQAAVESMMYEDTNTGICELPSSYLHYILSGPKVWLWELASSPFSFFGDLVSDEAVGKMGGAGTFLLIDPRYRLVVIYLTNYGQPARTLKGDEGWNKFQKEIDMMALCNVVIGGLK